MWLDSRELQFVVKAFIVMQLVVVEDPEESSGTF